tara:strand:- start:18112 stop:21744 length:3633 start_codon:yes stop_codon:yes gene_type:complete
MADMDEYSRLMKDKREETSFTPPPLVRPEVLAATAEDPDDKPLPFEEDVRSVGRGAKAMYDILDKYSTKALTYPARFAADPVGKTRELGIAAADAQEALVNLGKAVASGDPKAIRDSADLTSMVPGTGPFPDLASALASYTMAGQDVAEGKSPKENILWGTLSAATLPLWWLGTSELRQASKMVEAADKAEKASKAAKTEVKFGGYANQAAAQAAKRQNIVDHKFADEYDAQLERFAKQDRAIRTVAREKLDEGFTSAQIDKILDAKINEISKSRQSWLDDWTKRYQSERAGFIPESKRKAMHEAENARRVARGEEPVPYQTAASFGLAGRMEEALPQPMGGDIKGGTGRKSSRTPTREDELRDESRQVVAQTGAEAKFRKMTPSERKQYDELGEIIRRDPNAPVVPIVDDSGKLIVGKEPPVRQAKDVTDPYPEGTAEAIAGIGLPTQASKGGKVVGKTRKAKGPEGRGVGTEGMPESLLEDLSLIAQKEFPGAGGVLPQARYFDGLTADQQQAVLSKARENPGLARELDAFEQRKAAEAAKAPTGTGRSTKASRARMAEAAEARRAEEFAGKGRKELQAGLRGKRKATGTTQMLRKRAAREASQEGLPTEQFLREVDDMTSRFSPNEIAYIKQEINRGTMPASADSLDFVEGMSGTMDIVKSPSGQFVPVQKVKGAQTKPVRRKPPGGGGAAKTRQEITRYKSPPIKPDEISMTPAEYAKKKAEKERLDEMFYGSQRDEVKPSKRTGLDPQEPNIRAAVSRDRRQRLAEALGHVPLSQYHLDKQLKSLDRQAGRARFMGDADELKRIEAKKAQLMDDFDRSMGTGRYSEPPPKRPEAFVQRSGTDLPESELKVKPLTREEAVDFAQKIESGNIKAPEEIKEVFGDLGAGSRPGLVAFTNRIYDQRDEAQRIRSTGTDQSGRALSEAEIESELRRIDENIANIEAEFFNPKNRKTQAEEVAESYSARMEGIDASDFPEPKGSMAHDKDAFFRSVTSDPPLGHDFSDEFIRPSQYKITLHRYLTQLKNQSDSDLAKLGVSRPEYLGVIMDAHAEILSEFGGSVKKLNMSLGDRSTLHLRLDRLFREKGSKLAKERGAAKPPGGGAAKTVEPPKDLPRASKLSEDELAGQTPSKERAKETFGQAKRGLSQKNLDKLKAILSIEDMATFKKVRRVERDAAKQSALSREEYLYENLPRKVLDALADPDALLKK